MCKKAKSTLYVFKEGYNKLKSGFVVECEYNPTSSDNRPIMSKGGPIIGDCVFVRRSGECPGSVECVIRGVVQNIDDKGCAHTFAKIEKVEPDCNQEINADEEATDTNVTAALLARIVELMAERNQIESRKVAAIENLRRAWKDEPIVEAIESK